MDALELLRTDHDKVNRLFQTFERGGGSQEFQQLFQQLFQELTIHTQIEEQVFYPALRNNPQTADLISEAYQEHNEAKQLLTQASSLDNTSADWGRVMTDLMRAVQHHVQEEEGELFPKVRQIWGEDQLQQVGQQLQQAKQQAMQSMPQMTNQQFGGMNDTQMGGGQATLS